jgi:hypothetical protein
LAAATGRKHPPFKYFYYSDLATFRIVISAGLDGSNPAEIMHSYVQLADMTELNNQPEFRRNSSSVFGLLTR